MVSKSDAYIGLGWLVCVFCMILRLAVSYVLIRYSIVRQLHLLSGDFLLLKKYNNFNTDEIYFIGKIINGINV